MTARKTFIFTFITAFLAFGVCIPVVQHYFNDATYTYVIIGAAVAIILSLGAQRKKLNNQ